LGAVLVVLTFGALVGCGKDANSPADLKQQQAMAAGHPPTQQELKDAMSHINTPSEGQISAIPKPQPGPGASR
jgi:hypothetical protein